MKEIKVLMIDDNKSLVDMIEEYFSDNEKIKVVKKAYSGLEGIKVIDKNRNDYDVIILDLIMPNKDGIYVLDEMKKRGINKIKEEIIRLFNLGELETEDMTYLSNARSIALLNKAKDSIEEAANEIAMHSPIDIVEFSLKDAWNSLGEIIGETYTDELLDELFSRFCLGK